MKKKFLAAVLILALAAALCPATLAAGGDFTIANGILVEYNGAGGDVTIPDGVTYIGDIAFCDRTDLTGVTIPSSVTRIGNHAFYGCSNLTDFTIPDSVTSIGSFAFSGCTGLTSLTIPGSAAIVEPSAFYGCTGLTAISVAADNPTYCSVDGVLFNKDQTELLVYPGGKVGAYTIPDSVTTIDNDAFSGCVGLTAISVVAGNPVYRAADGVLFNKGQTELLAYPGGKTGAYTIPDGVTGIGHYAFSGCTGLTDVTIPGSVTDIGVEAFSGCTHLTGVTIPGSVTGIGSYAFFRCSGLTGVTIGDGVTSIGSSAFYGCSGLTAISVAANNPAYCSVDGVLFSKDQTELLAYPGGKAGAYTIPDGVTTIGYGAFQGCTGLTGVTIPGSVTTIGRTAFGDCTGLTDVTIGNGVADIEDSAFDDCTGLTNVTIPGSVTMIGYGAFGGCTGLAAISVAADDPAYRSADGVLFNKDQTQLHTYPGGKMGAYTIPDGVTTIGYSAFLNCTGLTGVTIPAGVTAIGDAAFAGCTGLTDITIPDGVTGIEALTFEGCTGLTDVRIPDSLTTIEYGAFNKCTSLTDVYYGGTQAQWAQVSRDAWFPNGVTIHYNVCLVPAGQPASGTLESASSEALPWTYEADTVTIAEPIPEDETVMVACFDESGAFTDVKCLSADQLNASIGQPDHFKLIWLDGSLAPQCAAPEVLLTP